MEDLFPKLYIHQFLMNCEKFKIEKSTIKKDTLIIEENYKYFRVQ